MKEAPKEVIDKVMEHMEMTEGMEMDMTGEWVRRTRLCLLDTSLVHRLQHAANMVGMVAGMGQEFVLPRMVMSRCLTPIVS